MDEIRQVSHTTQAAPGSAEPYRRRIIGLPLQRSLFGLTARAAASIGLPSLISETDFPSWLNENGDLILDRGRVAALAEGLRSSLEPATLEVMYARHVAACETLSHATEKAASVTASPDRKKIELFEALANSMALVLAYGILSKFVPDVLLRGLADAGDAQSPPFPAKSAGAELMQESFALYRSCDVLRYNPERLRQEWPDVPAEVAQLVRDFCRRQTGFGPLAWDSPGYEDPAYVVRLLCSAFKQVDAEQLSRRLSFPSKPEPVRSTSRVTEKMAALRRLLGLWLDFLERETWYVRRAFYLGMIPLLHQMATSYRERIPTLQTADLLFLELNELTAGSADPAVIRLRHHVYMENTDYLLLHGIDQGRLETMLASS